MKQFSLAFLLFAFTLAMVTPDTVLAKRGGDDDGHYEYSDDHDDDDDDDDEDEDEDEDEDDDRDDDNSNDELEVEADVFTDITIVKVELSNGRKTVFTTTADTRAEVVDVVADRFDLTEAEVEDALDFEIEDRASRDSDFVISSNNNDDCDDEDEDEDEDNNDDDNGRGSDAELRNRIAELQRLLQTLIQLFNSRFGN